MSEMESESIDLIFADPPYFLSTENGITCQSGKMVSVKKGDWDKSKGLEEIHTFNRQWISECFRLLKESGSIFISGTFHNIYSIGMALQQEGFSIVNNITWQKLNPPPNLACKCFTHSTETVIWAVKDKKKYYFNYSLMKESYFKSLNQFTITVPQEECSEHTITRYSLFSAATCEKNAVKCGVCDVCGYVDKIEIEGTKHGHAVESYKTVFVATCVSNAIENGTCTLCNETVTRARPNTATGHTYGTSDALSSKCTTCGKAREQEPVS